MCGMSLLTLMTLSWRCIQFPKASAMVGSFCVLFRVSEHSTSRQKLSSIYSSLELAVLAAFELKRRHAEPLQVRGSDGIVIEKAKLDALLAALWCEAQ
jgi:hypothetical protein